MAFTSSTLRSREFKFMLDGLNTGNSTEPLHSLRGRTGQSTTDLPSEETQM